MNLGLRGVAMGSKFLLIVILSKYVSEEAIGELGLLLTTITILVFLVGLDFYNYATRELLIKDKAKPEIASMLFNQYIFYSFLYILFIPILYFTIPNEIIAQTILPLFLAVLILEHFSQELYRTLIALEKQILANLLLFFRTGLWIALLFFLLFVWHWAFSLTLLLQLWIIGSSIAVVFGLLVLYKTLPEKKLILDIKWIRKGIKISIPFLLATLSYKVIEYSDRYMIDLLLGKNQTGIYIFYANIANIMNIFVNTIVIILLYPPLIKTFHGNDSSAFFLIRKKFISELVIYTFLSALFLAIVIYPILNWQQKDSYYTELSVYFILVLSNIALNLSFIPHYLLYAKGKDKIIFYTTFIAALFNIILNYIGIKLFGILGAGYATLVSYLLIMLLKMFYNKKYRFDIEK